MQNAAKRPATNVLAWYKGGPIMLYSEIINKIDDIFLYFRFNNKNFTEDQKLKLQELQDLIHELRLINK